MNAREGNGERRSEGLWVILAVLVAVFILTAMPVKHAFAAEGGGSQFTPGAQGDFAMCYLPAGLYFRNNIIYTEGELDMFPVVTTDLGAPMATYTKLKSKVWWDLLQIVYSSDFKILGGRYFASANIPYIFSQDLELSTNIPDAAMTIEDSSATMGFGDAQLVPFGLLWDFGSIHLMAAQNLVVESGSYDMDKVNNAGRNYFSYDELIGCTWLDEKNGHEVSFMAGYMINTRNDKTEYKTGDELHIDFNVAQYFSKSFGVGAVGYFYKQITKDESPTLDLVNQVNTAMGLETPGEYKSKGYSAGPAVYYCPKINGKDVSIIAKWLHEFGMENRMEGEWVYLSGVVKF